MWKFIIHYSKGNRLYWFAGLFLSLLSIGAQLLMPYANKLLVDDALINKSKNGLILAAFVFGISALAGIVFEGLKGINNMHFLERISYNIRVNLQRKINNLADIEVQSPSRTVSNMVNDVNLFKESYTIIQDIMSSLMQVGAVIVIVSLIDWRFTFLVLGLIPVYVLWPKYVGGKITRQSEEVQNYEENIISNLNNSLSRARELRVFQAYEWNNKIMKNVFKSIIVPKVRLQVWHSLLSLNHLFYWLVLCVFVYAGGLLVLKNSITPGLLIALINYIALISGPVNMIVHNYGKLQESNGAFRRLKKTFDLPEITVGHEKLSDEGHYNIVFKDVDLKINHTVILENINLEIKSGSFVGITGRSGSGKSSIFKLLCRLVPPTHGEILIQDKNIEDIEYMSFFNSISIVFQDNHFFEGNIRENLEVSGVVINETELDTIMEAFELFDLIKKLPYQYDTALKNNASNLSGGQKQRLAIVRSIIKNTPILLLDEVTSALDNETENDVFNAIKKLREGRTTIIITHNQRLLESCSQIFEIEKGKIIEHKNSLS